MFLLELRRFMTELNEYFFICCFLSVSIVTGQTVQGDVRTHPNWRLLDRGEYCGLSARERIIGGNEASLGQYPWIARIGIAALRPDTDLSDLSYSCGGTLITDRYVLTAAHCDPVHNFPAWLEFKIMQVRLGEHDVRSNPDCRNGVCAPPVQDVDVEEYFCHPGYERVQQHDDICLIRLARPVVFNRYVHPICLPMYEWFQRNEWESGLMEVAGWGISDLGLSTGSNLLMTVTVPVVQQTECQELFPNTTVTPKQLCAGGVVGQDSCTGDSGGPLMASVSVDGPPRYFLMGIVSYGDSKCGSTTSPGVYTKTTKYLTWVLDRIRE